MYIYKFDAANWKNSVNFCEQKYRVLFWQSALVMRDVSFDRRTVEIQFCTRTELVIPFRLELRFLSV